METIQPRPEIEFTVYGTPAPKGSKSAFPIRRKDGSRGVAVVEGKTDRQKDWSRRIEEVVQGLAERGAPKLEGPVVMSVRFYMPKPASAPKRRRTLPAKKPDLSKLLRAIEDPISGVLWRDDAQVVEFAELFKAYADDHAYDTRPRAEVSIWSYDAFYGLPVETGDDAAAGGLPSGGGLRPGVTTAILALVTLAGVVVGALVPAGWWLR